MLDTYIGANDGVPFTIPGRRGFLTTMEEFPQKKIPDYIEAVENPNDPNDLGTVVAHAAEGHQAAGRGRTWKTSRRCASAAGPKTRTSSWEWEMEPMDKVPENKDSCVVLYWA